MIKRFIICVASAFMTYFILCAVLSKPLTDGELEALYNMKLGLLKIPGEQRLFILAGSNGRFSHSCAVLSEALHRPCGNLSIAAGLGLDFLFGSYLPGLHRGDTVYMPLEYEQYAMDKASLFGGPDNIILLKHRRDLLARLGLEREIHAVFFADEHYFIEALAETALAESGVRRRFTDASVNAYGDQQGHTEELGEEYAEAISEQHPVIPDLSRQAPGSYAEGVIKGFLHSAREKGVRVIGGLPTTFDDVAIPDGTARYLKQLYESQGQEFLALSNRSQYKRACFFDIAYHLNSRCQTTHSLLLAAAIRRATNDVAGQDSNIVP
jgi:hypothetical protein